MNEETAPKRYVIWAKDDFFGDGVDQRIDMVAEAVELPETVPLMAAFYSSELPYGWLVNLKCEAGEITAELGEFNDVRTKDNVQELLDGGHTGLSGTYMGIKREDDVVTSSRLAEVVMIVKDQMPRSRV